MSDDIKSMFVNGNRLHIVQDGRIHSVLGGPGEPNTWKVEHFANVGTSEPFVEVISGEFVELMGATHLPSLEKKRATESLFTLLTEGLLPSFENLKRIRASVSQQMPLLNRRQLYEDFSRVLWHTYKDLFPKTAKELGFEIGFLFKSTKDFEEGVAKFNTLHPSLIAPTLGDYLRKQRDLWQSELAKFRNDYLEHRKEDSVRFASFYQPEKAEDLFGAVWTVIADVLPIFIEANFAGGFSIEEIPQQDRDPARPRRFRYV
jgi:hypothetical protein